MRKVASPLLITDVPLGRKNEIVVADLPVVALFPFAAIGENDVVRRKGNEGVVGGEVPQNRFWLGSYM